MIFQELFRIVKMRNLTFVLFVVVSHIIGDKFYARFCLFVLILNGLGIRVLFMTILVDIRFKFHHLMSYIVLILCPSKLEIDNILSGNKFIEVTYLEF